ncbi:uncharacterized protein M421DRAFT_418878 [Didymella exigua CBS 183.55]|uniref:Uncharacterized protein n=1 Tax=Didymella exigua CBS 183.55 TaxID=1150837 RepID=A0A6A5RSK0_9PLEO|nr:uncharacterized protein M421DRAFT_418878 [Didymella exigua CBS 183.55]KAF1930579.1 hypothetical protein M421DRAFT_418878 [Didymella exigua CBS 183.55]
MAQPTPSTWTLRLKSHRTTVLLHTDPLSTFSTIKAQLYTALAETGLQASEDGPAIPLPDSAADIQLGRPLDPLDPGAGFALAEWEDAELDEEVVIEEEAGKGKGRARAKAKTGEGTDCPKAAGLKDGAVLAFRWEGMQGVDGDAWGVQIASFEDAYGVANEGDVGGRAEFEG